MLGKIIITVLTLIIIVLLGILVFVDPAPSDQANEPKPGVEVRVEVSDEQ